MIKPIMKSEFFLRLPSEDAGPDDAATGQDLLDTLHEHERECVGRRRQHDRRAQTHHLRKGQQQDTPDVQPSNS